MFFKTLIILVIVLPSSVMASLPAVPFSGPLGATGGTGSLVGWERNGFGINPAVRDRPSIGFSAAGYSPYGFDGIGVAEAAGSWDGRRWGTSVVYRGLHDPEGGSTSAFQLQESVLLFRGLTTGLSMRYQDGEEGKSVDGGAGVLWRVFSFLTLGSVVETVPMPWGQTLETGLGIDIGFLFYGAYAWRLCVEHRFNFAEGRDWKYGAELQLHSLLSLYGGWDPRVQTAALGIRFGMGNWEGFSALRRHFTLGTTSIQGLHWRRQLNP